MSVDDDDRARFAMRDTVSTLVLVLEDLDRSGLLSAGHADCGDGAAALARRRRVYVRAGRPAPQLFSGLFPRPFNGGNARYATAV